MPGSFRLKDLFVTLACLSVAVLAGFLFRGELLQTINAQNETPVGSVIIIENNVQRRGERRLLWDRLALDSPLRAGDSIRAAEHSAVTLQIGSNFLDVDADTLVRIKRVGGGFATAIAGEIYIELIAGSLSLIAMDDGQNTGLAFNFMGRPAQAAPGAVFRAAMTWEGMALSVSQGSVFVFDGGAWQEIPGGGFFALNADGTAAAARPAVVVTYPRPNARYLKYPPGNLALDFQWNRVNLNPQETLLLEVAYDRNFTQIAHSAEGLDSAASLALGMGVWHWRVSGSGAVLGTGRIEVADSSGPHLVSPITDSLYRFQWDIPRLRFQWDAIAEAASYIVEVSAFPDFANLQINRQTDAVFLVEESLGAGTWHWRVTPVFPPVYEGVGGYSLPAFFSIEQGFPQGIELPIEEIVPDVYLLSPEPGASLAGLTALRYRTVFLWEFDGEISESRFVLSRSPNPLAGVPAVQVTNPARTVIVNSINEGLWYWTVEVQTPSGAVVAAAPRQLRVLPIPLLPEPSGRLPTDGHVIGIEDLRVSREILFSWNPVHGANAYVFSLFHDTGGRRELLRTQTLVGTSWLLEDVSVLYPGLFYWHIEAVNRSPGGVIQQRGRVGVNSFTLDVPSPGPVFIDDPGVLYGN
ncbi:MAG: hypothetical protein FWG66_10295 [Spirochaetes bacterium]|nr:hypothetical protein [Spirochaetota bacterium]